MKPQSIPFTPEEVSRFLAYHKQNLAWGCLHIVLEDQNVDDSSVEFCIRYAEERGGQEAIELGRILLQKSKTQRLKIGRDGYSGHRLEL